MKILNLILLLFGFVVYAQPSSSCTAGTTRLGTDGVFYGCVSTDKWVRISEPSVTTNVTMSEGNGTVKMANGSLHIKQNNAVHPLKNSGFTPIDIAGQTHAVGKTIYANNHFYEGVAGGKWHQIDNDIFTLPVGWSLEVPEARYLVSVDDSDYLPMDAFNLTTQPIKATYDAKAIDGVKEDKLSYNIWINRLEKTQDLGIEQMYRKGYIPVRIKFVKKLASASNLQIPPIISTAHLGKEHLLYQNIDRMLFLVSSFEGNYKTVTNTQDVIVYIAVNNPTLLRPLDMNTGLGQDGKGMEVARFDIAGAKLALRTIPAVPDRFAGIETSRYVSRGNDLYEHNNFYMPVAPPRGANSNNLVWLNMDLGAQATNEAHPDFYPLRSGISHMSKGSLFNWGRQADGHELFKMFSPLEKKYANAPGKGTSYSPGHSNSYTGTPWFDANTFKDILPMKNNIRWTNVCPIGYRVFVTDDLVTVDANPDCGNGWCRGEDLTVKYHAYGITDHAKTEAIWATDPMFVYRGTYVQSQFARWYHSHDSIFGNETQYHKASNRGSNYLLDTPVRCIKDK